VPPPQRRVVEPCSIIVPVQRSAVEGEVLELLAVVLEVVAGGVVEFKERGAKVINSLLSFCLDTKRNKKIKAKPCLYCRFAGRKGKIWLFDFGL
jgi:hypothetical protein